MSLRFGEFSLDRRPVLRGGEPVPLERRPTSSWASCSHGVLSGQAMARIEQAPLSKLIVTDSIPPAAEERCSPKIVVLAIAELMAKAIRNIHEEASVTSLFV